MILALGDRDPAFLTHREVDAALEPLPAGDDVCGLGRDRLPRALASSTTSSGVWLLPGTPYRDADAAFAAIRHCLDFGTPFLGTCGGFQHALVELARSRAGITDAAPRGERPGCPRPGRQPAGVQPLRGVPHGDAACPAPGSPRSAARAVRRFPLLRLRARSRVRRARSTAGVVVAPRPHRMPAWKRSSYPTIRSSSRPPFSRRSERPTRSPRPAASRHSSRASASG